MRKRKSGSEPGCPVAALIDVVFLLIVFFLVTMNMEKEVVDRSIKLAQAEEIKPEKDKNPRRVIVNLDGEGNINIANNPLTFTQLKDILYSSYQQYGNSVPVIIRADRSARFRHIDRVMKVVGEAGLYRVKIAAISKAQ